MLCEKSVSLQGYIVLNMSTLINRGFREILPDLADPKYELLTLCFKIFENCYKNYSGIVFHENLDCCLNKSFGAQNFTKSHL